MTEQPAKPRRRWYQFSLRAVFVLVTFFVGLAVVARLVLAPYREQQATMRLIERLGGSYQSEAETTWLRFILGSQFQNVTLVNLADCDEPEAYLDAIGRLPRVRTVVVGGETFGDKHLARVAKISSLEGLVLDTTAVTDAAIADLRQTRQNLEVYKGQRRLCKEPLWGGTRFNRTSHPNLWKLLGDEYFREIESGLLRPEITNPSARLELLCRHVDALDDLGLYSDTVSDDCLAHLSGLSRLRRLFIYKADKVTDVGLEHLSGLTSLELLHIRGAAVTDAGMVHLRGMTNLSDLDLSDSAIGDHGVKELGALTNLSVLTFDRSKIGDAALAKLATLKKLSDLSVSGTSITDAGLAHLQEATQLITLGLAQTRITDEGLAHLNQLKSLLVLRLSGTTISDAGLEHLKALASLQHLELADTKITNRGLEHLKEMRTLRALTISRCAVTPAAVEGLQAVLPQCGIEN